MKKIISVILVAFMAVSLFASAAVFAASDDKPYLYDDAGVLTDAQFKELSDELKKLSSETGLDVVVALVTEDNTDDYFETTYYDNLGYGTGKKRDGILTVIIADGRSSGNTVVSLAGKPSKRDSYEDVIEKYDDDYKTYLAREDYYNAIKETIKADRKYIDSYKDSIAFHPVKKIIISLIIGFIIALIAVSVMKGKLKSVKKKNEAADYVVPGSFNLTESRDLFLYSHVTRTARAQNNSSGSSHTSSGGVSHSTGRF